MRIFGITVPEQKRLEIALTVFYGIGRPRAQEILDRAGVPYGKKATELNTDEEAKIGKKRIIKKGGSGADEGLKSRSLSKVPKKKVVSGTLYVGATYNNTKFLLADKSGNAL